MRIDDFEFIKRKPYNLILELVSEHSDKRIRLNHLHYAVCEKSKDLPFKKQEKYLTFFGYNEKNQKLFWLGNKYRTITGERQYNNLNNALTRLEKRRLIKKISDKSHSPYYVLTDRVRYCIEHNRFYNNAKDICDVKSFYPNRLKKMHIKRLRDINEGIEKELF